GLRTKETHDLSGGLQVPFQAESLMVAAESETFDGSQRRRDVGFLLAELSLHLLSLSVFGILGPGQPDLFEVKFLEDSLSQGETGNVIPVLMRNNEEINPASGFFPKVVGDGVELRLVVGRFLQDATVDQD